MESRLVSVSSSSRFLLLKLNFSFFVLLFSTFLFVVILYPLGLSPVPESVVWGPHTNAWLTWYGYPAVEVVPTPQLWRDTSGPGISYVRGSEEVGAPRQVPSHTCIAEAREIGRVPGLQGLSRSEVLY